MSDTSNTLKSSTQLSPLKQALLALEEMQSRLDAARRAKTEPIAVIGIGCRFPGGADSPDAYWQLLRNGVDAIREVPADRWDVGALYDPDPQSHGKTSTRWAGFLDRVDLFDPQFFNIAPREAVGMDPQQRLLLEVAWEALEHACQPPDRLAGSRTGVFIGITSSDYAALQLKSGDPAHLDAYYASGIAHSIASGRLSYVLGLQGPSVSLDTACSSSLVALHLAVQSLRNGECSMALAGGVNLILSPDNTISFSKSHMLAADGRCKTFDASADGFAEGEGCGVVVLKKLSDALADGDRILAVVRGTAVNQDGASSGLTAPNGLSQQAVIHEALSNAGVKPADVSYVEAHGTGTSLGDPIEVQALGAVLSEGRRKDRPFMLGSVKTNIGHLEAAAGVAGFIKVVLALQHREIPPHLHFKMPNPFIPWEDIPATVPTQRVPWAQDGDRRIAGLSSFGFSGTNAHIILEEAPAPAPTPTPAPAPDTELPERPLHLLTLSAKTPDALRQVASRFADHLGTSAGESLPDICFSANTGRAHLPHRLAVVCDSRDDVLSKLTSFVQEQTLDVDGTQIQRGEAAVDRPKVGWLFTGQGAQYVGMGRQLYGTQPVFRAALSRCDELLRPHLEHPLLQVLLDGPAELLNQTGYTQPGLFALEYALAQLWLSWGVQPDVVMGHSVGEYVAACVAGVFSLEDGLRLIATRARLMQGLPLGGAMAGAMAAIFAEQSLVEETLAPYAGHVSIAALNGPAHTVISGAAAELQAVMDALAARGIKSRRLNVSHAFHSPLMEPMLDDLEQAAAEVHFSPARLRLISNLTGLPAGLEITQPDYWRQHARQPVQFMAGMQALLAQGIKALVEVGPQPVLLGMGQRCWPEGEGIWLPSLRQGRNDWQQMLESLAALYALGAHIDWAGFDQVYRPSRRKLALPTYPFQRERYWFTSATPRLQAPSRGSGAAVHALLGQKLRSALKEVQFESQFNASTFTFLDDHRVQGVAILPAAAYLEMALAAGRIVLGANGPETVLAAEDVVIHKALAAREGEVITSQFIVKPADAHTASFELYSQPAGEDEWTRHASGTIRAQVHASDSPAQATLPLADIQARCQERVESSAHYQMLERRGFLFGPSLHGLTSIWRGEGEALSYIQLPEPQVREAVDYLIHPALLDACLQTVSALVPTGEDAYLPVSLERFVVYHRPAQTLWSYISARPSRTDGTGPASFICDVTLCDEAGVVVAEATGLGFARAGLAALQRALRADAQAGSSKESFIDWLYEVTWQPQALATQPLTSTSDADVTNVAHSLADIPDIAARVQQAAEPAGLRLELADPALDTAITDVYQQLDRLGVAYIVHAFRQLGWQPQPGETISAPALIDRLHIAERHRKLTLRLLDILAEEGILQQHGDEWEVVTALDDRVFSTADALMDETVLEQQQYRAGQAELALLRRCGAHLAEALRGDVDPLQLLFPNGSMTSAERLYQESYLARLYNSLVREMFTTALSRLPQGQRVRVLEIGAGTGGTTAFVLPALSADRAQYVFSDISPHFTARAQQKFNAYDFVQYQQLDIEDDPLAQGFSAQSFDIILAANVIHATTDLRATLRRVRQLLAPGGLLILLEVIRPQLWIDLTFGLTEGWWKFIDHDIRPAYPLLSSEQWLQLLTEVGFAAVSAPLQQEEDGDWRAIFSKQAVLLARAPIQQPVELQEQTGAWLVFADTEGVGSQLAATFHAHGERCVLVRPGETYKWLEHDQWQLNPIQPEHFDQLLREAFSDGSNGAGELRRTCRGVIHLWSLQRETPVDLSSLRESQSTSCGSALYLTQAMLKAAWLGQHTPGLWLVTCNAQAVDIPATEPVAAAQATVWGLGNTIALEHPDLRCVRVDIGASDSNTEDVDALFAEIWQTACGLAAQHVEDRVAFRQGRRYVARLSTLRAGQSAPLADAIPETPARRLEIHTRGALDNLILQPLTRRQPGPGEVEIRVHATGLNFKDVLNTLGMYPGEPGLLGGECSGTIVALGEGVTGLQPGDEVVALAPGCFSTHVVAPAAFVAPKPPTLTFEQAASVPIAFVTAYFALHHLGHMTKGDRVLIHAAAGGVGLAAVQLAQQAGAEIFATAGSAEKRAYLESLGVKHVMDSRSLAFAEEIRSRTGGAGVDIILNSLAGEFIPHSLSLLRDDGRFLELGKRGLLTAEQVAGLDRHIVYHAIDWGETAQTDPHLIGSMLMQMMLSVGRGTLKVLPVQIFPLGQAVDAFRYMAQARHTGKIVLTQDAEVLPQSERAHADGALALRPDATYLITGGLGGLGLRVAQWIAERGARHVVLIGRSSPSERARQYINALEQQGCQVVVMQADVSQPDQVAAVLSTIQQSMPPLRGVVSAAGVLDNGVLLQQDWSRFANVMAPKVDGTWNLHTLTRYLPLDFFVLFSSAAAVLGAAGQANHAAANAYQDALVHYRRAIGMPGLSINWGAWSEIGAAAADGVGERIATVGAGTMTPEQGVQAMEYLLQHGVPQAAILPMQWPQYLRQFTPGATPGFFSAVAREAEPVRAQRAQPRRRIETTWAQRLAEAAPSKRHSLLLAYVEEQVGTVLSLDPAKLRERSASVEAVPLNEMGLDSLMAVELRNRLGSGLGLQRKLSATLVYDYPTIAAIADYLYREILAFDDKAETARQLPAEQPTTPAAALPSNGSGMADATGMADLLENIEGLSDEEVDHLLMGRQGGGY